MGSIVFPRSELVEINCQISDPVVNPTRAPSLPAIAAPTRVPMMVLDVSWLEISLAEVRSDKREGAFPLQVPNGRYIVGLESFSPSERRAWRERHGVWQGSIVQGLAAMSDLLVLGDRAELPETLDQALPHALPSPRIVSGDALQVVWEVYGLEIGQTAEVRIGVNEARIGILSTVGQFLQLMLDLPELAPGDYELVVEVEPRGREAMRVTRRITVVEGDGP